MKKILLISSMVACSSLFALSDEQILNLFHHSNNIKATISKKEKIKGTNYEAIFVKIGKDDLYQEAIIFTDGKFIFEDIIDPVNKKSYKMDYENSTRYAKLAQVLNNLDKSKIISMGNDPKKSSMYIFTDPLCPYCRADLTKYEDYLKEFNLKIILAPINSHGIEAVKKAIAIQQELKTAKTDEQKLKIFRKYYDPKAKTPSVDNKLVEAEQKLIDSYFATGAIRGVPAHIYEADLKKAGLK